jgi:hypothetical protein
VEPAILTRAAAAAGDPPAAAQRLALLLNGREAAADSVDLTNAAGPVFTFHSLAAGTYGVSLRVDGVDLPLIGTDTRGRLVFLPGGEITIP